MKGSAEQKSLTIDSIDNDSHMNAATFCHNAETLVADMTIPENAENIYYIGKSYS